MLRIRALTVAAAGLVAAGALLCLPAGPGAALADTGWNLAVGDPDGDEPDVASVAFMDTGWN
ncbi:hypothetical protein [Kitasatospora sp. MBT63]|uniref:hypothetical protein n=1 Tax=Kitasatospora sp. MBT63 TaxID=1444768 RepID=UPI0005398C8F|nr:hypothetical protein [Kitasatospora sp. MBT63]